MAAAAAEPFQVGVEGLGQAQHRGHLVLVHLERKAPAVGGLDQPLGEPEGDRQAAGVEAAPRGDLSEGMVEEGVGDGPLGLVADGDRAHVVGEVFATEEAQHGGLGVEHEWGQADRLGVAEGQHQEAAPGAELLPPHAAPLRGGEDVAVGISLDQQGPLRQVEGLRTLSELDVQQATS